jgi:hypothetical protein
MYSQATDLHMVLAVESRLQVYPFVFQHCTEMESEGLRSVHSLEMSFLLRLGKSLSSRLFFDNNDCSFRDLDLCT